MMMFTIIEFLRREENNNYPPLRKIGSMLFKGFQHTATVILIAILTIKIISLFL